MVGRSQMRQVRVIEAHRASYTDPIVLRKGDRVRLGRRDDEFRGWVWCTGPDGREGWTPEAYLEASRDPAGSASDRLVSGMETAEAIVDYDAHELTVETGDVLTVVDEASGWLLCERGDGGRGWVPAAAVVPLDPQSPRR